MKQTNQKKYQNLLKRIILYFKTYNWEDYKKPKKVLCKRSLIIGDPFYWDESVFPLIKIEYDNRMLVAGNWYNIVYNENDTKETFSIIDNQGKHHLHYMYTEKDKKDWPVFCKKYGPRDYSKWFYTPDELVKRKARQLLQINLDKY